jgi:hypothetical protein
MVRDTTVMLPGYLLIRRKGVVMLLLYPLFCGTPVAIVPRFDPDQFCQVIERYRVTVGFIVPPILLALAHHPGDASLSCTSRLGLIPAQLLINTTCALLSY